MPHCERDTNQYHEETCEWKCASKVHLSFKFTGAKTSLIAPFDYVMKLATLSSDGYPYVVPIWYFYEEEHFFILGRPNNKWVSNIYENQKISACIDSPTPPYSRVSFRADAEVVDKEWFGEWEHLAHRYLGC